MPVTTDTTIELGGTVADEEALLTIGSGRGTVTLQGDLYALHALVIEADRQLSRRAYRFPEY